MSDGCYHQSMPSVN